MVFNNKIIKIMVMVVEMMMMKPNLLEADETTYKRIINGGNSQSNKFNKAVCGRLFFN